ncbi:hypothetical protein DYB25_008730 [Aphanomyces astaci]|uniref:ATP synthase mitochondrial F1 complex assembly factor 2 n=1 Tax=Aphanomyces astaci TaxID=112090 RepID=A0A397AU23_APHAT|nr:hypothetical protein DYB25_008730 [Aphanomyces astaci]
MMQRATSLVAVNAPKHVAAFSKAAALVETPRGGPSSGSGAKIAGRSRFYKAVGIEAEGDGYCITLDGKKVRTPSRSLLQLPTKALAATVAMEWDAQREVIQPTTMPIMTLASTALDHWDFEFIIEELMKYLQTDTICFPVESQHQEKLATRQEKKWQPLRKWFETEFGGELDINYGTITKLQHDAVAVNNVRMFVDSVRQ